MNVLVDPNGPPLVAVPSNPVPEGARAGYFTTSDKVRLRYALFPRKGEAQRGTICLVQGRSEYIEKYFETIADFQARGFAVATFDLRGQGGSDRLAGRVGYVDRFEDYWTDLKEFHSGILLPDCPPPYHLVAHSMGGLVALDAGRRDRLMFDRMFLSAPMVALDVGSLSMAGTARLANALCFLGLGRLPVPVPGKGERMPSEKTFAGNPLTGDRGRYLRMVDILTAQPGLAAGSPSIRWVAASAQMMSEAARDRFPGSVRIPVLMLAAARDRVVSSPAIEQLGLRMRTGRHIVIAGAQHELFMETDAIRGQVLAAFDAFITEQSG